MDKWKVERVMSKENYLYKIKELPEIVKQFGGLAFLMIIVIKIRPINCLKDSGNDLNLLK